MKYLIFTLTEINITDLYGKLIVSREINLKCSFSSNSSMLDYYNISI